MGIVVTLVSSLLSLGVLALLSGGLALGVHLLKPSWSRRRRVIGAATLATLIPASLPMAALAFEADLGFSDEGLLAWIALIVLAVLLWAVCCLPAAWWATRRIERAEAADAPAIAGEQDEPALIGSQT